ncbi:glycosyltransferase [uncultured Thiodictyon sp.]|uniref:glycosyltransferase family 2 protein n=1 Tax=uncultured Thiodictyon sp. TaxID=1846217 RepID=UPI0025D357FD|nr:glycosyltransferase [uncultured Thiodictyon sp.]
MICANDITIVIPTYGREAVLTDTVQALLALDVRAHSILLIDQTPRHHERSWAMLSQWIESGALRRIHFAPPSIPRAMNLGLLNADTDYVLYLDDDIVPGATIVSSLVATLNALVDVPTCIAGQVLQPGEQVIAFQSWTRSWFPFNSDRQQSVSDVIACNLCVNRKFALSVRGFDENFKGAAFGFESEFARRVIRCGGSIVFAPSVTIRHLRAERGGTRVKGGHLVTWRPHHSVGKYYSAFLGGPLSAVKAVLIQPLRAIRTRHHLKAPWWIPATLCAELLGIFWAFGLILRGRRLLPRVPGG